MEQAKSCPIQHEHMFKKYLIDRRITKVKLSKVCWNLTTFQRQINSVQITKFQTNVTYLVEHASRDQQNKGSGDGCYGKYVQALWHKNLKRNHYINNRELRTRADL